MESDQWHRVAELFDQAKSIAPSRRGAFLDNACGADAELRSEIDSLLKYEVDSTSFLESPGADQVADLLEAHEVDRLIGQRIGQFEVISVLGYGGMGVVYLAEQTEPIRRRVALRSSSRGWTPEP